LQQFSGFSQLKSLMCIWAAPLDPWKKFFQINQQQLLESSCSSRLAEYSIAHVESNGIVRSQTSCIGLSLFIIFMYVMEGLNYN